MLHVAITFLDEYSYFSFFVVAVFLVFDAI